MTKSSSNISEKFLNNFPEIFNSPQKVNAYLQDYSKNIEEIIVKDFVNFGLKDDFAIYANGGFGRQELYPSSDIDLSIIQKKKNINNSDNLEKFIAKLWDLGLQVGHSVRTIKDIKKIAKEDPKEFTSYLTRRPLLTNKKTDKSINLALSKIWSKKKFYKVKLSEQEERYKSFFSTEYNLEPNLKESPGTLRDFQTSLWILQHCFDLEDIDDIKKSKEFNPLSPAKASFYSAVLPGLGQAYNGKYWKVPIVYAALGTGVYFYVWNNDNYNRYRDAYKLRINGKPDGG